MIHALTIQTVALVLLILALALTITSNTYLLWRIYMKLDEALQPIDTRTTELGAEVATQSGRITELVNSLRGNGVTLTAPQEQEVREIVARLGGVSAALGAIGTDPKDPAATSAAVEEQPAGGVGDEGSSTGEGNA